MILEEKNTTQSRWTKILLNPLFIIVLLGIWLRFGRLFDLPFTYDEYSSLQRINYDSYADMLRMSVRGDGHPAGLYSFLRLYVSYFGDVAWVVKLPFLLMNILSIWLSYWIGKKWFSEYSGWIAAAMIALLAFPLSFGILSRMYVPGLLFVLLAVCSWTKLLFLQSTKPWKWSIILGLCFALCVYTHYFAALFCVLLWTGGWIFVKREQIKYYVTSALLGALLFIPHLDITLEQLGIGGIPTVLPIPGFSFIVHHFSFISNFSWILGIPIASLFMYTLAKSWKNKRAIFTLYLWISPLLVGMIYSVLNSPILQDRALLFSLPFLGVFLGSALAQVKRKNHRLISVATILLILICWMDGNMRLRYELLYAGEYKGVLEEALNHNSKPHSKHLLSYKDNILDYQGAHMDIDELDIINPDSLWTLGDYDAFIRNQYPRPLSFAWTTQYYIPPYEVQALLRQYYGPPSARVQYPSAEFFQFGGSEKCIDPFRTISILSNDASTWKIADEIVDEKGWTFKSNQTWGLAFEDELMEVADHFNDRLYFSIKGQWKNNSKSLLVVELVKDSKTIYWSSRKLAEYPSQDSSRCEAHICLPVYGAVKHMKDVKFRAYIWNKEGEEFTIQDARIWSDGGNYMMYALNHPIVNVDPETHMAQ